MRPVCTYCDRNFLSVHTLSLSTYKEIVDDAVRADASVAIALQWPLASNLDSAIRLKPLAVFDKLLRAIATGYEVMGYHFDDRAFTTAQTAIWCGFAGERPPRFARGHDHSAQAGRDIRRMVAEYQAAIEARP